MMAYHPPRRRRSAGSSRQRSDCRHCARGASPVSIWHVAGPQSSCRHQDPVLRDSAGSTAAADRWSPQS